MDDNPLAIGWNLALCIVPLWSGVVAGLAYWFGKQAGERTKKDE